MLSIDQPRIWAMTETRLFGLKETIDLIFNAQTKQKKSCNSNLICQKANSTFKSTYRADKPVCRTFWEVYQVKRRVCRLIPEDGLFDRIMQNITSFFGVSIGKQPNI